MTLPKLRILPDQAGYVYNSAQDIVSIKLDGGLSRVRRDIENASALIDVRWTCNLEEYQYLMSFYNSTTDKGLLPFNLDLLLNSPELEEYACKFVANSIRMSEPIGYSRVVTAQLEVVPIKNTDLDTILAFLYEYYYPNPIDNIFGALSKLSNLNLIPDYSIQRLDKLVNIDLETTAIHPVTYYTDPDIYGALSSLANIDIDVI